MGSLWHTYLLHDYIESIRKGGKIWDPSVVFPYNLILVVAKFQCKMSPVTEGNLWNEVEACKIK